MADGDLVCAECALRRALDQILPPAGRLGALRETLLAAEPLSTRRWLRGSSFLLQGLDAGRIPLTHESLDSLPRAKAAEHLRALLIGAGVLEPDAMRALRRLEHEIPILLSQLSEEHRRHVTRWVKWSVLPALRTMNSHTRLQVAAQNARRKITQTVMYLRELQAVGLSLDECTQSDIDTWFAGAGAARWQVGPFLSWAQQKKLLPRRITLPRNYKGRSTAPADAEERWQMARRLVAGDDLDPVDRMAGALIVLYAQRLSRIVTLTTDDVIVDEVSTSLRLGTDALELPEPFATIIRQLPHRRRAGPAEQVISKWLFTGGHANQPLNATSLGNRMRAIGIQPRRFRLAATDQLARDLPPAMLAGILGLRITTLSHHTTAAKGQWANYAADRARSAHKSS